jgi:hypothetical protein
LSLCGNLEVLVAYRLAIWLAVNLHNVSNIAVLAIFLSPPNA